VLHFPQPWLIGTILPFWLATSHNERMATVEMSLRKPPDTVGQPPSTEIGVLNMPSLKVKKLRKLPRDKVLLELGRRLANSITTSFTLVGHSADFTPSVVQLAFWGGRHLQVLAQTRD